MKEGEGECGKGGRRSKERKVRCRRKRRKERRKKRRRVFDRSVLVYQLGKRDQGKKNVGEVGTGSN